MNFMRNVEKKLTATAKSISKASDDIAKITRLKLSIGNEEDRIRRTLYEIGCDLYKDFLAGNVQADQYSSKCTEIKQTEDNIKALKEKILLHKGRKSCTACGTIVNLETNYCPNCGTKFEAQ